MLITLTCVPYGRVCLYPCLVGNRANLPSGTFCVIVMLNERRIVCYRDIVIITVYGYRLQGQYVYVEINIPVNQFYLSLLQYVFVCLPGLRDDYTVGVVVPFYCFKLMCI